MIKKSYRVYHGNQLMPWSTGMAVWQAGGFVFLAGAEGRDPDTDEVPEGIGAQARIAMQKIKERLEQFGTSLDNICHIWYYVKGPDFPNGVALDPKWVEAKKAIEQFLAESGYPEMCKDKKPPATTLLGISSLALKEMLIEITVIAALPPLA